MHRSFVVLAAAAIVASAGAAFAQTPAAGAERFAPEIAAFATQDKAAPKAACAIVFTGSSSVRFWKSLEADMAPFPVINRGFGGAQISDVNAYFDQVVTAYRPRAVVFYAGENDLSAGETVASVVSDFERFMRLKTEKLGAATPVYFVSLKPSPLREAQKTQQDAVNAKVQAMSRTRKDLRYIDVAGPMLGPDGEPRDVFLADGLHMTPAGYAIWTKVVRPAMDREMKTARPCRS